MRASGAARFERFPRAAAGLDVTDDLLLRGKAVAEANGRLT